jgi:dipeptidyl aminopeptidase/acylaminoacyl peptidase
MRLRSAFRRAAALALLFTVPFAATAAPDTAAAATTVQAGAPLPTLASFFDNSSFGGALLSPSGRYLAARSGAPGHRVTLMVIDLQANTAKMVANDPDADIGHVVWVNDERLAFGAGTRLYAVNRDGSNLVQLTAAGKFVMTRGKLLPGSTFLMGQAGAQDSEWLYVTAYEFGQDRRIRSVNLLRLNTLTLEHTVVQRPAPVTSWMLDNQGKPRLAVGHERDQTTLYYLDPANQQWRSLFTQRTYADGRGAFTPLGFGPDGTLYLAAHGDKDTRALYAFDYPTGKLKPEPLVETKGYDFSGGLIANRAKLLGVRYETDGQASAWFDPAMQSLQEKIDKLLPSTVNLISVAAGPDAPCVLVHSYSDVQPPVYMLYNLQTGRLNKVGEARPGIDARRMATQEVLRYKARDGLEIPALLTVPPGTPKGAKLPLVMLVHDGPYRRGTAWGWNPQSQFLASRGYAVIEPDFRGSTGYGARHFMAGWKQWGLKMQDDIADGARWAIAQGIADPKRICIAGAGYGGYAALMGLVKDTDLYRCGVDWGGITDIAPLYDGAWIFKTDLTDEWKDYGMRELIGDPDKDAEQFKATSPLRQAARIHQPLLMAYGGPDYSMSMFQGRKLYAAVIETNKQVEWIDYQDWPLPKIQIDFWSRVEKFLDKHIGKDAAPSKP